MSRAVTTILIAPDSFKGSLTSVEVAAAIAYGWSRARPTDTILQCPLADGGEGTLEAVAAAGGWSWRQASVTDPLGRPIGARWLLSDDGRSRGHRDGRGVRSVACRAAASATRWPRRRRDRATWSERRWTRRPPTRASGSVAARRPTAGRACSAALGAAADRDAGTADLSGLDPRLAATEILVACDVSNPLLGPSGAAAIYGPQKGATPARRRGPGRSPGGLRRRRSRRRPARVSATSRAPARPAASGSRLLAIAGRLAAFALRPGIDLVMEATDFDARLATADLVITGEGRIDAQTAFGKTALGVARRAQAAGVPCVAVGGGVEAEGIEALARVGAIAVPVTEHPQTVEAAMSAGTEPLERCAERIARLVSIISAMTMPAAKRQGAKPRAATSKASGASRRPRKRKFSDPARSYAKRLERYRPGLVDYVLSGLEGLYGRPGLAPAPRPDQRADPDDPDPEQRRHQRRGRVPGAARGLPIGRRGRRPRTRPGLGRRRAAGRRATGLGRGGERAAPRTGRGDLAGRAGQPEGAPDPGDAAAHPRGARRLLARIPRRHGRARALATG